MRIPLRLPRRRSARPDKRVPRMSEAIAMILGSRGPKIIASDPTVKVKLAKEKYLDGSCYS